MLQLYLKLLLLFVKTYFIYMWDLVVSFIYKKSQSKVCLNGKTAIVTGGSDGEYQIKKYFYTQ